MNPADDWQLAQGTVEFRDEERRHRNRTEFSSGLSAPAGGTDTPVTAGRVVGMVSAGVPTLADSPTLCPNCIVEVDADCFCSMCGRVETGA